MFDPTSPTFLSNPYETYSQCRKDSPRVFYQPWDAWFLFTYKDCSVSLKEKRLGRAPVFDENDSVSPSAYLPVPEHHQPIYEFSRHFMLLSDPPTHTRLRSCVKKSLTPAAVESFSSVLNGIVDDLIAGVVCKPSFDFVSDFAIPFPVRVTEWMLGLPEHDREQVREWALDAIGMFEFLPTMKTLDKAAVAFTSYSEYLQKMLEQRNTGVGGDTLRIIDLLLDIEGEKEGLLSRVEVIAMLTLLTMAGHETTVNMFTNSMRALLLHPQELEKLLQRPALLENIGEETLRYDCPVQFIGRQALCDFDLELPSGTLSLKKGQQVLLAIGSANRDEEVFEESELFKIDRLDASKHLAFGMGIHYCIGAPLARLEARLAYEKLVAFLPYLELVSEPAEAIDPGRGFLFRGYQRISVKWKDSFNRPSS